MYLNKYQEVKPKIIELIHLAKKCNSNTTNEFKTGKELMEDFFMESSPNELEKYFESLTDDEIMIIQAVMYIGRDTRIKITDLNFENVFESWFKRRHFELGKTLATRHMEIDQIIGKKPLSEYLMDGIRKIKL